MLNHIHRIVFTWAFFTVVLYFGYSLAFLNLWWPPVVTVEARAGFEALSALIFFVSFIGWTL